MKEIHPWETRNNFVSGLLSKVKLLLNILGIERMRRFHLKDSDILNLFYSLQFNLKINNFMFAVSNTKAVSGLLLRDISHP